MYVFSVVQCEIREASTHGSTLVRLFTKLHNIETQPSNRIIYGMQSVGKLNDAWSDERATWHRFVNIYSTNTIAEAESKSSVNETDLLFFTRTRRLYIIQYVMDTIMPMRISDSLSMWYAYNGTWDEMQSLQCNIFVIFFAQYTIQCLIFRFSERCTAANREYPHGTSAYRRNMINIHFENIHTHTNQCVAVKSPIAWTKQITMHSLINISAYLRSASVA